MKKLHQQARAILITILAVGWPCCAMGADRYNITDGSRIWPTGVVVWVGGTNSGTLSSWVAGQAGGVSADYVDGATNTLYTIMLNDIAGATNGLTPVSLAWSTDYARVSYVDGATNAVYTNVLNVVAGATNGLTPVSLAWSTDYARVSYVDGATNAAVMRSGWFDRGIDIHSSDAGTGTITAGDVHIKAGDVTSAAFYENYTQHRGDIILQPGMALVSEIEQGVHGSVVISNGNLKLAGNDLREVEYIRGYGDASFIRLFANNAMQVGYGNLEEIIGERSFCGGDGQAQGGFSFAWGDGEVRVGGVGVESLTNAAVIAGMGSWEGAQTLDAFGATAFGGGMAWGYKSFAVGGAFNGACLGMAGYFGQTIASNHYAVAMGANSQALAINSVAFNGTVNNSRDTTSVGTPKQGNNAVTKDYADAISNAASAVYATKVDLQSATNAIPGRLSTLNGTNGFLIVSSGTNYWILLP